MPPPGAPTAPQESVRLDRWLWAARCFRTRSAASAACSAGHVKIDGLTVKASRAIRPGVTIHVRTPGGLRILEVVALAQRRGPASVARTLYVDHSPPPEPADPAPAAPRRPRGAGRPSKRDRRRLRRLRGQD